MSSITTMAETTETTKKQTTGKDVAKKQKEAAGAIMAAILCPLWALFTAAARKYGAPTLKAADKQNRTKVLDALLASVDKIAGNVRKAVADAVKDAGDATDDAEKAWIMLANRGIIERAGATASELWNKPIWKYVRSIYGQQNNPQAAQRVMELVRDQLADMPMIEDTITAIHNIVACDQTVRLKGGNVTAHDIAAMFLAGPESKQQAAYRLHSAVAADPVAAKAMGKASNANLGLVAKTTK